MIRDELMSLSSVMLATLVRMNGADVPEKSEETKPRSLEQSEDNLPEYSDELPDGFDDVLGKLM
jgi:hypothetical protein